MIGILEEHYYANDAMIWLKFIYNDLLIYMICMQNKIMNKNKIKWDEKRKKKLLVSFGSSEVSSSFEDVVTWRFRQHFIVASSPKEFLGFLAILEFFSLLLKP